MSIVQQYGQLWESSSTSPDVFAFLEKLSSEDSDELLGILLEDQKRRWRTENPLTVEDYLARLLNLPEAVDWKLQLAIGEFEARRATGQPFDAEDISSRFPDLSDTLRERMKQVEPARPTDSDDAASALLDELCDRFEAVCAGSNQFPRIEDFLFEYPPAHHRELFIELLQIELWWRRRHGGTPATSDYSTRFQVFRLEIESLLERSTSGLNISARSADVMNFGRVLSSVVAHTGNASSRVTYISANGIGEQQKGRYRLDRVLGEGAFGRVYLGFDEELHRQVAIKVPTKTRFHEPEDAEAYLAEARTVASLDHPNIVPVFDMGRTQDGSVYVVSKFIEGETLKDRIKSGRLLDRESANLVAKVARALQHAHFRRLIHRDIKPANILLEGKSNAPFVADFGLAIREEDYLRQNVKAGTPAYMSPEQIRGEGHRLDGRSDIFSLGVLLYELLTGQKPFQGSSVEETLHLVRTLEPRPPREFIESIPAELERICSKAMHKRVSDRYATAAEFAEDLEQWLNTSTAVQHTKAGAEVIPKGLRSFDAIDADFFLELLPGQKQRDGLPESISFWKQRIEQTDAEHTFSVGLLYGPSGCGKSSLVKAGLLPHLSKDVVAIYVEATPEETELRVLRGLRKWIPKLREEYGLTETLAALRRDQGCHSWKKIVIVIDQFEQWLHTHRAEPEAELVNALRQCDGIRLNAIVMVRDDFAMAAVRFMDALDIRIVQDQNFRTVDLFDVDHAGKVLTMFGQAFGRLPARSVDLTSEEQQFVSAVANGVAQDGKVVSVRLSLFAEMIKGKPWTTSTLKQVGGLQGIGFNFLDETFSSAQSNPNHRRHSVAARAVLRALLPEQGSDIKGNMRSHQELQDASGYGNRPSAFIDLLRILDGELRLITPTDPEGDSGVDSSCRSAVATRYYQLTHDYLVPALRDWLTRKQRESRKGRAELLLEERASIWRARREARQLPSIIEWANIRWHTNKFQWAESQRALMQAAGRKHIQNWGSLFAILALMTVTLGFVFYRQDIRHQRDQICSTLDSLQKTLGRAVPVNIQRLKRHKVDLVVPELKKRYESTTEPREKLSLAFALASYGHVDAAWMVSQIDDIEDSDTGNLITALGEAPEASSRVLSDAAALCQSPEVMRRKARFALTDLGLGYTKLAIDTSEFERRTDQTSRTWFIDEFHRWELDRKKLLSTVGTIDSPALRSAVCLGLGRIPVKAVLSEDRNAIQDMIGRWYALPDSSTHCAAAWLMTQWQLPQPSIAESTGNITGQGWYRNSLGMTMVLATPKIQNLPLRDPLEAYRQRLSELRFASPEELAQGELVEGELRLSRALAFYELGDFGAAFEDLSALASADSPNPTVDIYRTLALARLGRREDKMGAGLFYPPAEWKVQLYRWTPVGPRQPPADWRMVLKSDVVAEWTMRDLSFNQDSGLPVKRIDGEHFAAVATSRVSLSSVPYSVTLTFEDGIRVSLDDEVIFENWASNDKVETTFVLTDQPGEHVLQVEYIQIDGAFTLDWKNDAPGFGSTEMYLGILVPLWLGQTELANTRLNHAIKTADSMESLDVFKLACVTTLVAGSEPLKSEGRQRRIDQALSLLEQWNQSEMADRQRMREDPDLLPLHAEDRFRQMAVDPSTVPSSPYWIASREVTRGEFEMFAAENAQRDSTLRDWKVSPSCSPTKDNPANTVSLHDAILYCNWLSSREQLRPAYRSIGKIRGKNHAGGDCEFDQWAIDPSGNGYRLPDEPEWLYACRVGTSTKWSPGNDESLLSSYSQGAANSSAVCGSKLPNAWGLHDMHGNIREWCWNNSEFPALRGGCFVDSATNVQSDSLASGPSMIRDAYNGFRICRTWEPVPLAEIQASEGRNSDAANAQMRALLNE